MPALTAMVPLALLPLLPALALASGSGSGCTIPSDCSLNGVCAAGACVCDPPWSGSHCGVLAFAAQSPAAGKDLANTRRDLEHNTWNGPMVVDSGTYHMYVPLYPAGELYHPVSVLHGTAPARFGPWTWGNLTAVEVSINPGALQYVDPADGRTMRYTLWVSKPDGGTLGKVYTSTSAGGPFVEIPNSNSTGCSINPSPLMVDGAFYCTGQKGDTLMTANRIEGPWTEHASIPHRGEDPFIWVDARKNWHALFHTSGNPAPTGTHCGNSTVASHVFSADNGKTWSALNVTPTVEPYKPSVVWEGEGDEDGNGDGHAGQLQTYATMERPHLYFDGAPGTTTGRATHLGVASTLNIGDEGCPDAVKGPKFPGSKCRRAPCPCQACKYVAHAGTLLIALA